MEKRRNNIEKIIFFLKQDKIKTLIINQVNDEIGSFYLLLIRDFAKVNNVKLDFKQKVGGGNEGISLFGDERLEIFSLPTKNNLERIIGNKNKKIIFTDYRAFKKYQRLMECINGYNYISDIKLLHCYKNIVIWVTVVFKIPTFSSINVQFYEAFIYLIYL